MCFNSLYSKKNGSVFSSALMRRFIDQKVLNFIKTPMNKNLFSEFKILLLIITTIIYIHKYLLLFYKILNICSQKPFSPKSPFPAIKRSFLAPWQIFTVLYNFLSSHDCGIWPWTFQLIEKGSSAELVHFRFSLAIGKHSLCKPLIKKIKENGNASKRELC